MGGTLTIGDQTYNGLTDVTIPQATFTRSGGNINVATAGYIKSGTVGTVTAANLGLTSDGAATKVYATTSDQTVIAANHYRTGAITLSKLSSTNYSAGNIKHGVTITVNNGNANVYSVQGTFYNDGTTYTLSNVGTSIDMGASTSHRYITTSGLQVIPTATYTASAAVTNVDITGYGKLTIGAGSLSAGNGSAAATGTNITLGTKTTTQPTSGSYITVTGSGGVSVGTGGWIAKDTSKSSNTATAYYPITQCSPSVNQSLPSGVTSNGTINRGTYIKIPQGYNTSDKYYLAQGDAHSAGSITNNTTLPSGSSSSGTINRGSYIKIGAGYYTNDLYYLAQADAHSAGSITNNTTLPSGKTSSGTINRNSYIKIGAGYYTEDKYYLAQADAHSSYTPSSTYFQTSTTGAVSAAVIEANKYASSAYYVKSGVLASTGGAVTGSNATLSDTDTSGVSVTGSGKGNVTTAGWIAAGAASSASSQTKYLTGVTINKPSSGTRTFAITVPNGTGTITFNFKVDSSGNVWVE